MAALASSYSVIYAFGDGLSDAGDAYLLTNSPAAAAFGLPPETGGLISAPALLQRRVD